MKQSIFDYARQSKESVQSFVLRVWQEQPGQWRGTIHHVQSETRRGFERFEQAQQFIERFAPTVESSPRSVPNWFRRSYFKPAFALITMVILSAGVAMLSTLNSVSSASATAVSASPIDPILIFLAGAVLGGSAVGIVLRLAK